MDAKEFADLRIPIISGHQTNSLQQFPWRPFSLRTSQTLFSDELGQYVTEINDDASFDKTVEQGRSFCKPGPRLSNIWMLVQANTSKYKRV